MSQVITLYRLQKLDSQREKILARLEEIRRSIEHNQAVHEARLRYTDAQAQRQAAIDHEKTSSEVLQAVQIKIEHNQAAQFGGKLHTPKELQDLQSEQAALEKRRAELEDEQIRSMLALELSESILTEASGHLETAQQKGLNEASLLRGEADSLNRDLENILKEKDAVASTIPADLTKLYEKLHQQKKGVAVTIISEGSCASCGAPLTPAECQAARSPSTINYCPSCGRILYAG